MVEKPSMLAARFSGFLVSPYEIATTIDGTPYCRVYLKDYKPSIIRLKKNGFLLSYMAVVEWRRFFELVLRFYNPGIKMHGMLSTLIPVERPVAPSIADIYPAAAFYENEAYEFFGIVFEGHPGHRRLFTDDELGHPFRKEYELQETPIGGWKPYEQ